MLRTALLTAALALTSAASFAAGAVEVPELDWSFNGLRADWDKNELFRGYNVATNVCLACHSFKYISHRDLMRVGFTEGEVQALAKALGKTVDDKLISGLDAATAVELYGKVPPDLSVMNKARVGGADYTHAILTGYTEDEEEIHHAFPKGVPQGAYYNKYFPGHAIAMPNPLTGPDMVTYHDGTSATVEQMSRDVTTFMQFTAEPEKIARQRLGIFVLLYLAIFAVLAFFTKRAIWRDIH
jgi:ubiquinol-cytochrome c reductase cytochrome c1 subunit